ncbi:YesN/AraC family two-component response regulator [Catenibacillus scindens]|uniref:YesN/AraC family two-component response regulator n=1 Tax=Catenibacillus scindens TaxID=673271 RepID=A0A7W8HCM1_9FIRM|nr:AraC family transcriptional regulator [Catenibacillus scindens]MBB5265250.1 YesN/AraC family two-component response regulator [Catenibacillus scindens]
MNDKSKEVTCKEEFYNFKALCDAALHRDPSQTKAILEKQSRCLFDGEIREADILVFLTSMNRSFYNYILYTMDLSLYQCCYENVRLIHRCKDKNEFFQKAGQIIHAYCHELALNLQDNPYIIRAREYISSHLDENLHLEDVADHLYISKAYLSELFCSCAGCSFSTYITSLRMEKAGQLLRSTALPIHDIGAACGFLSPAYFSTVFARHYGVSPRQYRRKVS